MTALPLQGSFIPSESRPLVALGEVNRRAISAYVEAAHSAREIILDINIQLVETTKEGAQHYLIRLKASGDWKMYGTLAIIKTTLM